MGLGGVILAPQQGQQFLALGGLQPFQGEGQQQRRPGGQNVAAGHALVVAVALPVLQVVEDLEGDAEVLAELGHRLLVAVGRAGQAQAGVQGGLEGGSRLQGVDLQGVEGRQRLLARVAPEQLGPLPLGQLQVGVGELVEDVGGAVAAQLLAFAGHQPVAEADQVVADVDGRADAVLPVQRGPAVAEGVVVLDVVVDQRRLVERLDGQGRALHRVGQLDAVRAAGGGGALEGVVGGQGDEGPRALAALAHPVVGDRLVLDQAGPSTAACGFTVPRARGASRDNSGSSQTA